MLTAALIPDVIKAIVSGSIEILTKLFLWNQPYYIADKKTFNGLVSGFAK